MKTKIIIAREKFYNEDGSENVFDVHFPNFSTAYNYYREGGFLVQPKYHGAKKVFPPTDTVLGGRCVVNFFQVPCGY